MIKLQYVYVNAVAGITGPLQAFIYDIEALVAWAGRAGRAGRKAKGTVLSRRHAAFYQIRWANVV